MATAAGTGRAEVVGTTYRWPRHRHRLVALLGAVLLLLAGCGGSARGAAPEVAAPAEGPPVFTATTLSGGQFDSRAAFGARPTVLWFWAPWCTICRAEALEVRRVAQELGGQVSVVGVAGRGEQAAMREFVAQTGTEDLVHVVDSDGTVWSSFGVVAQPAFAFVGADGSVEVFNGALPPADLRAAAQALTGA